MCVCACALCIMYSAYVLQLGVSMKCKMYVVWYGKNDLYFITVYPFPSPFFFVLVTYAGM